MVSCRRCGAVADPGVLLCRRCGTALPRPVVPATPEWTRYCPSCGREVDAADVACSRCGHDLRPPDRTPDPLMADLPKGLLYLLSILVPFAGLVTGGLLVLHPNSDYRFVGRMCIALGLVVLTILLLFSTIALVP